jgi:serine/threonine-protein kinase
MRDVPTARSLKEWFSEAAALDEAEIEPWLASRCPPEFIVRIRGLLAADRRCASDWLDSVHELAAHVEHVAEQRLPGNWQGRSVGDYTLRACIGEGGMSAVYRADARAGSAVQSVAVKLVDVVAHSQDRQRWFLREQKALASLAHPNIARLIDAGVDNGTPYLVMELIEGESLMRYATERKLDVRARVMLFHQICLAVAYAHRQLVVHRDLKPSNILVTPQGQVKLLDFGIAKLLSDHEDETTRVSRIVLTPEYAAPEQMSGGSITTATDVFSLGIVLHQLLLGVRPNPERFETPSESPRLDADTVCGMSARSVRQQLRGDLDNVIRHAVEIEPERRYPGAEALAEDINRYLNALPVHAHPPSRWYRARKFLLRHRGAVAVTTAMAIALVAALAVAVWQGWEARQLARLAQQEARRANAQAARANSTREFLESLFGQAKDGADPDRAPTLAELVNRGLAQVETSRIDSAETRAELLLLFARINDGIGAVQDNLALSQRAVDACVETFGTADERSLQARALHARVLDKSGDYAEAAQQFRSVLADMRAAGMRGSQLASALDDYGFVVLHLHGPNDTALQLKLDALRERERDQTSASRSLGSAYNNIGNIYDARQDWRNALHWYERAYQASLKAEGRSIATAISLGNVGNVLFWTGQYRASHERLLEARAIYQHVGALTHTNYASMLIRLCDVEAATGLFQQAFRTCDEAVQTTGRVFGLAHPNHIVAIIRRASAMITVGDFARAREDIDTLARLHAAEAKGASAHPALYMLLRANLAYRQEDFAQARDLLLSMPPSTFAASSPGAMRAMSQLALACAKAPAPNCHGDELQRADELLKHPYFRTHAARIGAQLALARLDAMQGRPQAALDRLDEGEAISALELASDHPTLTEARQLRSQLQRQF